ncbi:hypothetical protein N7448_007295 [Penicillium atrosanguineum]|uniref:Uncharacterized protein n=1 Tax=Penicillium atrosanguineum TaxID=1132637 RepID=A0A9W9GPF8_9EURO|nr:uncharacterized protein N7443_001675 [Penicillium atrosanguineum]KAJ5126516.1 hypothetical protein N7448_007295 [Penicillium atrosanguineum]KAJ5146720.1 hypothetical protein N7526_000072 [Penicillium atrosanguineum]KAJ5314791.1 hypothetical protein N7443_001675 [Penicillium atrosanguineum]KAJ5331962.1 hypothetical protein N7476_001745 [Penicillium atrosanguineum]
MAARKAVQGIATSIGLVSEGMSARKSRKQSQIDRENGHDHRQSESPRDGGEQAVYELPTQEVTVTERTATGTLEEQWALDEAQEELAHPLKENVSKEPVDEARLANRFISAYPAPPPYTLHSPLPQLSAPVVLPQRRPKNRTRGFIRAYAPALGACGIDQAMFINFLDTAEKACQASPWLNAINLASIATTFLPSVTGIAVSIAIQIATDIAIAVEGRRKTNTFFDKVNKEFFQPRGLFCLVMTWNPELSDAPSTAIDLDSFISKATSDSSSDMLGRLQHKFKSSDGKTYGNIFPEVAPLIFPQIDQLAVDKDAEKKLSKMKQKKEFVANYMDKRAQAKFTAKNPDSHLSQGPKPTFTSRYADPNHPASSGDLIALVTGGKSNLFTRDMSSNPPAPHAPYGGRLGLKEIIENVKELRSSQDSAQMPAKGNFRPECTSSGFEGLASPRDNSNRAGPLTPVAKLLKKQVLYLAIVNMPSENEMTRAREALGQIL